MGRTTPREAIPQSADELTAEWFTDVLAERIDQATVTAVRTEIIGAGIGFVGELHRCQLTWDRDDARLPSSVVAKMPSALRKNRAMGEGLLAYEREILVYRDLAGRLGIAMPDHIHSAMDPNPAPWLERIVVFLFERLPLGGINWTVDQLMKLARKSERRFLLVIEDIDDAQPPSQVEEGSLEDVQSALGVLADFHAANWQPTELVAENPFLWPLNRTPKVVQAGYKRYRESFVARFGEMVESEFLRRMDELQAQLPELVDRLVAGPSCLLHGDYRLDNIMFRPSGDMVVLDYQLVGYGRPGWDVAYFITTALSPEHRGAERELLEHYHAALVDAGVTDHSFDELAADVRLTKELLAHRLIGTGDLIDTAIADHDDSFIDLLVRRTTGWVDLD
ncbi:MAG: ecdysteroid 22-kinase family protein [Acidimicrobiia bacterium]|nr:ecdysteroid 22-kinase family protein [Acidimicrobiia bacterium]